MNFWKMGWNVPADVCAAVFENKQKSICEDIMFDLSGLFAQKRTILHSPYLFGLSHSLWHNKVFMLFCLLLVIKVWCMVYLFELGQIWIMHKIFLFIQRSADFNFFS